MTGCGLRGRTLRAIAAAIALSIVAASCGQKGPLYLPDRHPAEVVARPATASGAVQKSSVSADSQSASTSPQSATPPRP